MLLFCLLILVWGGLSAYLVFYFSKGNLTSWFTSSGLSITDTAIYLLPTILLTNLIATLLIAVSTIAVTLFVSHKIAGPIYRLEKDIEVIADGDLTFRVKFRKGDQLKELSEEINAMSEALSGKVLRIQSDLRHILSMASDRGAPNWFQENLRQLLEQLDQFFIVKMRDG